MALFKSMDEMANMAGTMFPRQQRNKQTLRQWGGDGLLSADIVAKVATERSESKNAQQTNLDE